MASGLPDFYQLGDALYRLDADFSAAETHGIYCAVLSINANYDQQQLQSRIAMGDRQDYYYQELSRCLDQLYLATWQQLNAGDLDISLLLPEDDAPLEERLPALQKWCQGFAYGLALSGLTSMQDLPPSSREWAEDVVKIGASGEFDLGDEEGSEAAFAELTEFLRVGLLMINEEVQPVTGAPVMD